MSYVTLRSATPEDNPFYFRVYASTRTEEIARVDWTDDQKEAFLCMQFNAQTEHYLTNYPNSEYQLIQREDIPIGRSMIERSNDPVSLYGYYPAAQVSKRRDGNSSSLRILHNDASLA